MESLVLSHVSTAQLQPNKPIYWPVSLTEPEDEGLSVTCEDEIENL